MEAPTLKPPEPRRRDSASETSRVVVVNKHAPDPAITRIPDDPGTANNPDYLDAAP
jgi:hypothetical protein